MTTAPPTASDELTLDKIVHDATSERFRVSFEAGGAPHEVEVTAKDLDSFGAFRRCVLGRLGILVRHEDFEGSGRRATDARERWLFEIEGALAEGRRGK